MTNPGTSIIIPTYNGAQLLAECISSIRTYTPEQVEIIVVDNGSDDDTTSYCRKENIPFISLPRNEGFPAACNYGLKMATGDSLLLLNNDIVVSHNWLTNMLRCLHSDSSIGIVGPMANYVSGKQLLEAEYETLEQFHETAKTRNQPNELLWQEVSRLVGMCFLFKRDLMDRIGYLDEQFSPGHYEDDDYCYRARKAGYRMMIAGDVIVHHHGSLSFKKMRTSDRSKLIHDNHKKFMEKWGFDPLSAH